MQLWGETSEVQVQKGIKRVRENRSQGLQEAGGEAYGGQLAVYLGGYRSVGSTGRKAGHEVGRDKKTCNP